MEILLGIWCCVLEHSIDPRALFLKLPLIVTSTSSLLLRYRAFKVTAESDHCSRVTADRICRPSPSYPRTPSHP